MAPSVEKLAHTGVFFTVTSLHTIMNVHAEAGNPLSVEGRAGPWEASGVRSCYTSWGRG